MRLLALLLIASLIVVALVGCRGGDTDTADVEIEQADVVAEAPEQAEEAETSETPAAEGKTVTTESGLKYQDLTVGTGSSPKMGDTVVVHYTGWLTNGKKFDSSVDRGRPFEFTLGVGMVIKGWDEGVATMKIGGKRKLTIPSELGYGERGAGSDIPPGATLVFEVELLDIRR